MRECLSKSGVGVAKPGPDQTTPLRSRVGGRSDGMVSLSVMRLEPPTRARPMCTPCARTGVHRRVRGGTRPQTGAASPARVGDLRFPMRPPSEAPVTPLTRWVGRCNNGEGRSCHRVRRCHDFVTNARQRRVTGHHQPSTFEANVGTRRHRTERDERCREERRRFPYPKPFPRWRCLELVCGVAPRDHRAPEAVYDFADESGSLHGVRTRRCPGCPNRCAGTRRCWW
jgi:hypothetical protein